MRNGIIRLHFTGKQVLTAIGMLERFHTQIQHHINGIAGGGRGEAQQRAHQLPYTAVVIVHIGAGLTEIEVLRQHRFGAKYRRLIVHKAFQIHIQGLGNVV